MGGDWQHWIEILGAALVGVGGWLWRVSGKYSDIKNAIGNLGNEQAALARDIERLGSRVGSEVARLEQRIAAVDSERSDSSSNLYKRLDEIAQIQAAQGAQIAHIADTCTNTSQTLTNLLARHYHPGGGGQ